MINKLKEIVNHNEKQISLSNGDQGEAVNLFTINHNGSEIYDFFYDETLRDEVNPLEYYREDKLIEVIQAYNNFINE